MLFLWGIFKINFVEITKKYIFAKNLIKPF